MLNHFNITIYGNVQGVYLRRTIEKEAKKLGVNGFVRNESDGTVYIEAEGIESVLNGFITWLRAGASGGGDYKINLVESENGTFKAFDVFEIK